MFHIRFTGTGGPTLGGEANEEGGHDSRCTHPGGRWLLLKAQSRQDCRTLFSNGVKAAGIEAQCLEDCGSDLRGPHEGGHRARIKTRIRNQHHHIGIVVRKTAMLRMFRVASRIHYSDVRLHDNVGRARVAIRRQAGFVEHRFERRPIEDLAEADSGRTARLERADGTGNIGSGSSWRELRSRLDSRCWP